MRVTELCHFSVSLQSKLQLDQRKQNTSVVTVSDNIVSHILPSLFRNYSEVHEAAHRRPVSLVRGN